MKIFVLKVILIVNFILNLVTLSMPRLGELRQIIGKNKEAAKAVMDQINSDVKAGIMAKEEAATEIPKKMKESLEQLKNEHQDSDTIFRSNDIVIGNYRFERENSNYEWTIVELSQVNIIIKKRFCSISLAPVLSFFDE